MNIGLVLCGGFLKGAYQVGALRALQEVIPKEQINCISVASIGTLNGFAFAADRLDWLEEQWLRLSDRKRKRLVAWIMRERQMDDLITDLAAAPLRPSLKTLYCPYLDLRNKRIAYQNLAQVPGDELPKYLRASISFPVVNPSVRIGENRFYDGALADNVPVYPLLETEPAYLISFDFDNYGYRFDRSPIGEKTLQITLPSPGGFAQSLMLRRDRTEQMIRDGYDFTAEILHRIFACGWEDREGVLQATRSERTARGKTKRVFCVDILATGLNHFLQDRILSRTVD